MRFRDMVFPTKQNGWWGTTGSISRDELYALRCMACTIDRKQCQNVARFYESAPDGSPDVGARALCLVHFRREVGQP